MVKLSAGTCCELCSDLLRAINFLRSFSIVSCHGLQGSSQKKAHPDEVSLVEEAIERKINAEPSLLQT